MVPSSCFRYTENIVLYTECCLNEYITSTGQFPTWCLIRMPVSAWYFLVFWRVIERVGYLDLCPFLHTLPYKMTPLVWGWIMWDSLSVFISYFLSPWIVLTAENTWTREGNLFLEWGIGCQACALPRCPIRKISALARLEGI